MSHEDSCTTRECLRYRLATYMNTGGQKQNKPQIKGLKANCQIIKAKWMQGLDKTIRYHRAQIQMASSRGDEEARDKLNVTIKVTAT